VRRVGVLFRKLRVEPILREIGRVVRNVEAEAAQAWGADEDEQRLDRLCARGEIAQALADQIGAGECVGDSMISADWELQ
jgi:hypothetical protein